MNLGELWSRLGTDLKGRTLTAGDAAREVSGPAVEEEIAGWLDDSDVAVTSRASLTPDFIGEVHRMGSPGIVWRSESRLADETLGEARDLGLGIIAVPQDEPLRRILSAFRPAGSDPLLRLSHRAGREMTDEGSESVSLEAVARRISNVMDRPVVVEDAVGRLVPAHPQDRESSALISTLHENGLRASRTSEVEGTRRERRDRYARLPDGFLSVPVERWRVANTELHWTPVGTGTPSGYLWIDLSDGPLTPEDVVHLYWSRRALKTELEKDRIRLETELGVRGDFVDDLISGHYGSVELLLQRARYLGADLTDGALVLIVDIDDFAKYLERRRLKEPAIQELKRRLADAVRLQARQLFSNFLTGPRSDNVILLIGTSENESAKELPEKTRLLATQVQRYVKGLLPDLTVSVGIGRYKKNPSQFPEAYSEAEVSLEIGHRIHGASSISTFEGTGTYKLLFKVMRDDPGELEAFYAETLGPVVTYDERYGTELAHTLITYLANDASTVKTASELFAHRHTIRYRLDRISELTDLDIEKSEDRERLTLGLKAMQLLERAPSRPTTIADR